jgi:Golgi nucleoside diphosphatase
MPNPPELRTVSDLVSHAAGIVDPDDHSEGVAALVVAFEEDDRDAMGVEDLLGELRTAANEIDPFGDEPPVAVTAAVAFHLTGVDDVTDHNRENALQTATRRYFGDDMPQKVRDWLAGQGVEV